MEQENKPDLYKDSVKDVRNTFKASDFFVSSKTFYPILKKTEKLTTAIYLVTEYLDEKESFKWEIRREAVSLLSYIWSGLSSENNVGDTVVSARTRNSIGEILILLELAFRVGFISHMNYAILKEEYMSLCALLENIIGKRRSLQDSIFPDNFFSVSIPETSKKPFDDGMGSKRQHKGQPIDNGHSGLSFSFQKQNEFKREDKNGRRESILNLVKAKGEVNIKDISLVITDCSEKTIQRELMSLIAIGLLKKRGERRWSTYSFNAKDEKEE